MSDVGYWVCPLCGFVVSGEAVVDPLFAEKVGEHEQSHADASDDSRE